MADSVIDLIFRIKKSGTGGKDGAKELNNLGASAKKLKQEFKDFKVIGQAFQASMSLVTTGIKAVADSAEHLGRTELKTAFAEAAEAGQDLQDTLVTLKIGGRDSIAWVTDAATGLKNLADLVNISGIAFAQMTGAMSDSEAAARATALVYEDVKLTTDQLAQAQIDLKDPLDESARANRQYATDAEAAATMSGIAAQKAYDYQVATEKLTGPVSDLNFAMGELTKATLFNQAAQGLDADAALALANKMGLVNDEALEAKQKLDELRVKFDENKDGLIDATEAANGYTAAVALMGDKLEYAARQANALSVASANAIANGAGATAGGGVVSGGSGGYASGADFIVPPGYPNDSYPMRVQSGERVIVQTPQQQQQTGTTNNWGGVTVVLPNVTNAEQFYKEMGRKADMRSRVG